MAGEIWETPPFRDDYQLRMQQLAWNNLPILNEWHRRFADEDPLAVHETFWQQRLTCPGGGTYRWNPEWRTMESTIYGHPGQPRTGPSLPVGLQRFATGNFGITFEENGLRARVQLLQE